MSTFNRNFTSKFFHPPQRTVSCHNGLLDTRTKHIVAKDRLSVAEQRLLDIEQRKSANNLQLLAFEQKQFEKRVSSRFGSDQLPTARQRSTSDVSDRPAMQCHPTMEKKLTLSSTNVNANLLVPPDVTDAPRRSSLSLTDERGEGGATPSDDEKDDDWQSMDMKTVRTPSVTVIPPDEDP